MKGFPVADLLDAVNSLGNLSHSIMGQGDVMIPELNYKQILNKAETLQKICQEYNLGTCSVSASNLLMVIRSASPGPNVFNFGSSIKWNEMQAGQLRHFSAELGSRVKDTLSDRIMIEIKKDNVLYFDRSVPVFGVLVNEKFPNSIFDIDEAGMCFALSRYTACVIHLMRAMEAAIQTLGSSIGVKIENSSGEKLTWGGLVSSIKLKIDSMNKGNIQDDWLKIHVLIHSCNRAYRTKAAHPVDKYTEKEAESALIITRSFFEEAANLI